MRVPTFARLAAAVCLAAGATQAYPTGMNIVPTAETLGARAASLQWENDSSDTPFHAKSSHAVYTQFGLSRRWEVGVDFYDVDRQQSVLGNAKCALLQEAKGNPGVALGFWGLGRHSQGEPYLVASRGFGSLGLTVGLARASRVLHPMGGVAMDLSGRWSIQADGQANRQGFLTIGTSYSLSESVSLTLYHLRCTDRQADGDFTGVNLGWAPNLFR